MVEVRLRLAPMLPSLTTVDGAFMHITEGDEDYGIAQTLAATVPTPSSSSTQARRTTSQNTTSKPPRYSTDAPSTSSRHS